MYFGEQQFSAIGQQLIKIIFDNCWYIHGNCCSQKRINMFDVERKFPLICRELKKIIIHENSRLIHGNSRSPQKTKNSMLSQHVKELIEIVFQLISDAKLLHSARALSVSDRLRPLSALFGRISPFMSICSYRSMPYCSATYLTATGGSTLSRGLTPSMASSSLWRDSHL